MKCLCILVAALFIIINRFQVQGEAVVTVAAFALWPMNVGMHVEGSYWLDMEDVHFYLIFM